MRPLFQEATKPLPSEARPEVLPYQRHTAPALSRRGEVKLRLGAAIRWATICFILHFLYLIDMFIMVSSKTSLQKTFIQQ